MTGTERCGQYVSLRMRLGVLGTDDAAFDETSDIGVVARKTRDGVGTHKIETAVANVREVEMVIDERKRGAGGTHAMELRVLECIALNGLVGGLKRIQQRALGVAIKVAIVDVTDSLYGDAAGLLSAFISAHAIGNNREAALAAELGVGVGLPEEKRIFVIVAQQADVAKAGGLESRLGSFAVNRHR